MYSKRVYNAECVNEEGKKSMKLSDGSMFIYTGGSEYINIYGAFDWEKIPGITSEVNSIPFICTTRRTTFKSETAKFRSLELLETANMVSPAILICLLLAWRALSHSKYVIVILISPRTNVY